MAKYNPTYDPITWCVDVVYGPVNKPLALYDVMMFTSKGDAIRYARDRKLAPVFGGTLSDPYQCTHPQYNAGANFRERDSSLHEIELH